MLAKLSRTLQNQFSNYFFSSSGYLYCSANSLFTLGTSNFTIEFWFNATSVAQQIGLIQSDLLATSTNNKWYVAFTGTQLRFGTHSTGGFTCNANWSPSANRWYHIAVTRSATGVLFFVDGVQLTTTVTGNPIAYNLGQNGISIGAISPNIYSNSSYISNVRISTTAIYTTAFSPPARSTPIAPLASTVLCMPLVDDIFDYSQTSATITNNNNVSLVTGNSSTLGQIVREIVQVCTGQITATSQLQIFDKSTSFITNTVASNWQLVFPTALTDASNVFVMRSACVNASKFKYARFILKGTGGNETFTEPKGGTANVYAKSDLTTVNVEMVGCTSVNTTSGYIKNSSYYHATSEGFKPGSYDIYISASSRHLLIYTEYNSTSNKVPLFAIFEHPETNITTYKNTLPVITYRGSGSTMLDTTTSRDTTNPVANNVAQAIDGYNIISGKTNVIISAASVSEDRPSTFDFGAYFSDSANKDDRLPTKDEGRKIISKDFIYFDPKNGHEFKNLSTLSNVFFIPNSINFCPLEYVYVNGQKSFMCMPLSSAVLLVPME